MRNSTVQKLLFAAIKHYQTVGGDAANNYDWKSELSPAISPIWCHGSPHCSGGGCKSFAGTKCGVVGYTPGAICEPAVAYMALVLDGVQVIMRMATSGVSRET